MKTHNILFIQINDAIRIRFTMMIIEDGLQGGKMITYCQFIAAVKQKVESNINRNVRVEVHITLKNNGKERRGLVFIEEGINISPTIYLEEFYQNFREGKALDEIIKDILEVYANSKFSKKWETEKLRVFENVRHNVLCKMINREKNREFLKETPYIPFFDLAIVCYVLIELNEHGIATMPVKKAQLEMWGIKENELFQVAKRNVQKQFPAELRQMKDVIAEMIGMEVQDAEDDFMYVLSNEMRSFGAVCITYDGVPELVGIELEENYYIIPSSVHEMIIVPESKVPSREEMERMVTEINETQVEEEEVLSNRVYFYDIRAKKMS